MREEKSISGPGVNLWRSPVVVSYFPVSCTHWTHGVKTGRNPAPVRFSTCCAAWCAADIRPLISSLWGNQHATTQTAVRQDGNRLQSGCVHLKLHTWWAIYPWRSNRPKKSRLASAWNPRNQFSAYCGRVRCWNTRTGQSFTGQAHRTSQCAGCSLKGLAMHNRSKRFQINSCLRPYLLGCSKIHT